MAVWKFSLVNKTVNHGNKKRKQLTSTGCNEPFKDRYWCPKKKWFMTEACPFINQRECRNFEIMSGERIARM
jgi:hypothetical protein